MVTMVTKILTCYISVTVPDRPMVKVKKHFLSHFFELVTSYLDHNNGNGYAHSTTPFSRSSDALLVTLHLKRYF